MRTRASVERKWAEKLESIRLKADFKFNILAQNKRKKFDRDLEYQLEKLDRKKASYLSKKEKEYRKKMLNEIREIEGKPKREYKTAGPKIKPIQFAMKIAQENARLRDTNANGQGRCISCNNLCEWEELAGGHRYSRMFSNMCLEKENINAQCHTCNRITGPQGNPALKIKTNDMYDRNIEKKFGEGTVQRLKDLVMEFTRGESKKYDLSKKIPQLIKENTRLWSKKSEAFKENHKPARNWGKIWEEYDKRH